jgi:hypothetical protein
MSDSSKPSDKEKLPTAEPNSAQSSVAAVAGAELVFSWDDPVRLMKSLSAAWREVTDRETPTFLQLVQNVAEIERVDADVQSGFVAIRLHGEAHHVIGLRREAVVPLVTVLSAKAKDEVAATLARGPAKWVLRDSPVVERP